MRYDNIQSLFQGIEGANIQKKIFAHITNAKYTYKQLLEETNKLSNLFQSNGLKNGDRIILSTNDDYYTALFFLSCMRYGIVTIFLDPETQKKQAEALIKKAEAKGIIMDEHFFEERNITEDTNQFQLKIKKDVQKKGRLFKRLLKSKNEGEKPPATSFPAVLANLSDTPASLTPISSSDLAYVLFTSGSTSEPKGVMITHENLFAQLKTLSNVYALNEQACLHNILPLYHVDGIIQGPLLTMFNQATWLRPMRFDIAKISDLFHSIYKYRASHFFCVPLMLSIMEKFSENYEDSFLTEDFKYVISSAAKLEKKQWEDFERKFKVPLINVYGLTESVAAALYCSIKDFPRKIGSVGVPIDCEAKITNADGSLAKENEVGLLWLKGANIFSGYFNNPEATAAVLKDGWLNTGDLAIKDDQGFYTITGRVKNMINVGGINIYPEQVSEMINAHPAVLENICFGIQEKNIGEKLVSAIALAPNASLNKLDLIKFLRPLLKQNQIPKEVYFFDELPKGRSGKIQLNAVEKLIANSASKVSETPDSNFQNIIIATAAESFGIEADDITMEDNAQTLEGWDSMAHLIFITALEKHFKLRFTTSEMMTMTSIVTTNKIVNQKLSAK